MKYSAKIIHGKDNYEATMHSQDAFIAFIKPAVYACQDAGMKVCIVDVIEYDNHNVVIIMPDTVSSGKVVLGGQRTLTTYDYVVGAMIVVWLLFVLWPTR